MINWQRNIALFLSLLMSCAFAFLYMLSELGYFWKYEDPTITPPFAVPFAVERAGNQISFGFEVTRKDSYEIGLMYPLPYPYNKDARDKIWNVISKKGSRPWGGAPLTIRVQVAEMDGGTNAVVFDEEITTPRISSHGAREVHAPLIFVGLMPGSYKVTAKSLKDAPELREIRVNLKIARARRAK